MRHLPLQSAAPVLLALLSTTALAQQAPLQPADAAGPGSGAVVPQVEVRGPGAAAQRRDDVLGRLVVGRDELQRFGDTGLAGVLARQPGLSVSGGQVRMRGLGAGYTQILIDGQSAPDGFAIGSLAPDLVERVEIQRSAQADASAQGIAGSINIVLRKAGGAPRRTGKIVAGGGTGAASGTGSLQWNGRVADVALGMVATADASRSSDRPVVDQHIEERHAADSADPAGAITERRLTGRNDDRVRKFSLAPRAEFKHDGDTLTWQGLADIGRNAYGAIQHETTLRGAPTASPDTRVHGVVDSWLVKSDLTWSHRMGDARLSAKAGWQANGRKVDYGFHGTNAGGTPWLNIAVDSAAFDRQASASGKYVTPLGAGHDIAVGWDGTLMRRGERRHQRNTGPRADTAPFFELDQDYDARVARLAWFVQDEWAVSPRLQVYLGVRREGLDTSTAGRTAGQGDTHASTTSRVWSPIAQAVWKLPGNPRDQVRVALARTYKAPQPRDMVPRRYTVNNDNGPATPDYEGNPLLRPELAWGLDAAWETALGADPERDGMASLSLYARRIRDVTLLRVWNERGTWVSSPANGGTAAVHGIEFDVRKPLAPTVALRANLARNWSRVERVPGPDNRLEGQVPLTVNLGLDLRGADGFSAGANFRHVGGGRYAGAQSLTVIAGTVRELEAYAAWRAVGGQWRMTFADLLHGQRRTGRIYDDGATASARWTTTPRHAFVRVQYEAPL